jgi:hypothetical protein
LRVTPAVLSSLSLSVGASLAFSAASSASAGFVGFYVTAYNAYSDGLDLTVYTLTARFDGDSDTVFRALNLNTSYSPWLVDFWHKDNATMDLSGSPISQTDGTWDPTRTGSNTLNRPFDSYLTIGGIASSGNSTRAASNDLGSSQLLDSSWGGSMLPSTGFSWRTSNDSAQGRVGNSAGVLGTDVRLGQFVLSTGHAARTYSLSILYNGGEDLAIDESNGTLATGTFTLGGDAVPAPGAMSLLAVAGLAARRDRRRR